MFTRYIEVSRYRTQHNVFIYYGVVSIVVRILLQIEWDIFRYCLLMSFFYYPLLPRNN
ncbi:hypothetical protein EDWATA_00630 [Edwardsiella tarda ATCC 23685]|uniref:Uncharacterized protein n=1 Tax=Edwardsiella tarda ATCC 23685 TaxID=500638 RepID=D4F1N7_EDWTA|nr:hypothetical protein EDWATA_00630 [Edwardsiella tarda ATCC 23685]